MDFTREPIIETIITPKDGCKLVVRSSKGGSQEEYFVDAVEVVSFGSALFFRSSERPKPFLVPISDYEIVEVREARMVLKNVSPDRSIKIGGGRGTPKEQEKAEIEESVAEAIPEAVTETTETESGADVRVDKKRDRRRHYKKKKNGKEEPGKEEGVPSVPSEGVTRLAIPVPTDEIVKIPASIPVVVPPAQMSALLQPPQTLISETINRYRENATFKGAFYLAEEEKYKPHDKVSELLNEEDLVTPIPAEETPTDQVEELPKKRKTILEEVEDLPFPFYSEESFNVELPFEEKKEEEDFNHHKHEDPF